MERKLVLLLGLYWQSLATFTVPFRVCVQDGNVADGAKGEFVVEEVPFVLSDHKPDEEL